MNMNILQLVMLILFFLASLRRVTCDDYGDDREWEEYKAKYGKHYSQSEDPRRKSYYFEAKGKIIEHNKLFDAGYVTYTLKLNYFADLRKGEVLKDIPPEEDQRVNDNESIHYVSLANSERGEVKEVIPDSFDWREKINMTPVTDQGNCSSCWAISAVGAIEARYTIATNKTVIFSKQFLVDCALLGDTGRTGCDPGYISGAFRYIQRNGLPTEALYPYRSKVGKCRREELFGGMKLEGHRLLQLDTNSEEILKSIIYREGPVAVTFDAPEDFRFYKKGVYYSADCTTDRGNHALLVIGYGAEEGVDFWLVKNSWGEEWGVAGYGKLSRNKNNNCGIASTPIYPNIRILEVKNEGKISGNIPSYLFVVLLGYYVA